MVMEGMDIVQLLLDAGLTPTENLTLTQVKEFGLQYSEIQGVPHAESQNPHGERLAAMKLYDAVLVAGRVLHIFGTLEEARAGIQARREAAGATTSRREGLVADMAL